MYFKVTSNIEYKFSLFLKELKNFQIEQVYNNQFVHEKKKKKSVDNTIFSANIIQQKIRD